RPVRGDGAARHDQAHLRAHQPVAGGRLYPLQPGRRPPRHADRERLEGHPRDAEEVAAAGVIGRALSCPPKDSTEAGRVGPAEGRPATRNRDLSAQVTTREERAGFRHEATSWQPCFAMVIPLVDRRGLGLAAAWTGRGSTEKRQWPTI